MSLLAGLFRRLADRIDPPTPTPEAATPASVSPIDYGHGYVAKQLIDGRWVLWFGGHGCDLKCPGYIWRPGTRFWQDCIGTFGEVDRHAKEIMAARRRLGASLWALAAVVMRPIRPSPM